MIPTYKSVSDFVRNYSLANKFVDKFNTGYGFPSFDKIVINSFIQDLDNPVSSNYPRTVVMMELLTSQKVIIKNVKKTLKGKKSYQVVVSHNIVLRKEVLENFICFYICFFDKGLEAKFVKINYRMNFDKGSYYLRIRDITALPGLSEEFFRWPYSVDCFFLTKGIKDKILLKHFYRHYGFMFLR